MTERAELRTLDLLQRCARPTRSRAIAEALQQFARRLTAEPLGTGFQDGGILSSRRFEALQNPLAEQFCYRGGRAAEGEGLSFSTKPASRQPRF